MTPTVKQRNVMEQVSVHCFSCGVDEFIRGDGGDDDGDNGNDDGNGDDNGNDAAGMVR